MSTIMGNYLSHFQSNFDQESDNLWKFIQNDLSHRNEIRLKKLSDENWVGSLQYNYSTHAFIYKNVIDEELMTMTKVIGHNDYIIQDKRHQFRFTESPLVAVYIVVDNDAVLFYGHYLIEGLIIIYKNNFSNAV